MKAKRKHRHQALRAQIAPSELAIRNMRLRRQIAAMIACCIDNENADGGPDGWEIDADRMECEWTANGDVVLKLHALDNERDAAFMISITEVPSYAFDFENPESDDDE